jgi:hypothetical protein
MAIVSEEGLFAPLLFHFAPLRESSYFTLSRGVFAKALRNNAR